MFSNFDYLFWFGDINYRTAHGWQETVDLIEKFNLEEIKKYS